MRRLRGVLVAALVWALAWILMLAPLVIYRWVTLSYQHGPPPWWLLPILLLFVGLWGGIAGAAFALVVTVRSRQHRQDVFTKRRAAVWGALAGAMPASALGTVWAFDEPRGLFLGWALLAGSSAFLGAIVALSHVSIARNAGHAAV